MLLDGDGVSARFWPFPVEYPGLHRDDVYAFNRAGRDAEITAGTFIFDHGMHLLGRTEYRINGTGLDTERATDAHFFINDDDGFFRVRTMFGVQRLRILAKQISKCLNGDFPTRWALVDIRLTGGNCLCVRPAAGVGALSALCLRQQGIYPVDNRVTLYAETDRRIGEHQANQQGETSQCKYCG